MNIVLDSNILFSALIRDSKTRQIILECDGRFLFPSFVFTEVQKHKNELLEKSGMIDDDFNGLLDLLLDKMDVVPEGVLLSHKEEAEKIVKDIDPDDALFVACALAYEDAVIWSDDKGLKKQSQVRVMDTAEIIEYLKV
jgi:predicted nucleic acid-binding protein